MFSRLIFAGGGARCAYQIGVWKALAEANYLSKITSVAGTSLGAFNAALFVQGDIEKAITAWMEMSRWTIAKIRLKSIIKTGTLCDKEGLREFFERHICYQSIFQSDTLLKICCTDVSKVFPWTTRFCNGHQTSRLTFGAVSYYWDVKDMNEVDLIFALLATCSLPIVYQPENIHGKVLIDGGFTCRTPLHAFGEINEEKTIVIHCDSFEKFRFNNSDNNTLHIFPRKYQGGVWTGTYDFVGKNIKKRISQGYHETLDIIEKGRFI